MHACQILNGIQGLAQLSLYLNSTLLEMGYAMVNIVVHLQFILRILHNDTNEWQDAKAIRTIIINKITWAGSSTFTLIQAIYKAPTTCSIKFPNQTCVHGRLLISSQTRHEFSSENPESFTLHWELGKLLPIIFYFHWLLKRVWRQISLDEGPSWVSSLLCADVLTAFLPTEIRSYSQRMKRKETLCFHLLLLSVFILRFVHQEMTNEKKKINWTAMWISTNVKLPKWMKSHTLFTIHTFSGC